MHKKNLIGIFMEKESNSQTDTEKEDLALEYTDQHMGKILETTEAMNEAVHFFREDSQKLPRKIDDVLSNEEEADEIKNKTMHELLDPKYDPSSREKIIRMVTTADDIADNAKAAATKLSLLDPEEPNEELKEELVQLSNLTLESVKTLKEAFSILFNRGEVKGAIDKADEVEKIEEEIDDFRAKNLFPKIEEWISEYDMTGSAFVLIEVVRNIEEVADRAEDTADAIRDIAIRFL